MNKMQHYLCYWLKVCSVTAVSLHTAPLWILSPSCTLNKSVIVLGSRIQICKFKNGTKYLIKMVFTQKKCLILLRKHFDHEVFEYLRVWACGYYLHIQTSHSFFTCVFIFRCCMHSWPVRQAIFSQQPLKNSSLSFMLSCIFGLSVHSRDSLVCFCTTMSIKLGFSSVVIVSLSPHPSMLMRHPYHIKEYFYLFIDFFPAEALFSNLFD